MSTLREAFAERLKHEPGKTPFSGLSGALGVAQLPRAPGFMTKAQADERGEQRAGKLKQKKNDVLDFLSGLPTFDKQTVETEPAEGTRPGMRSGMGMQDTLGLSRSPQQQIGMGSLKDSLLGG